MALAGGHQQPDHHQPRLVPGDRWRHQRPGDHQLPDALPDRLLRLRSRAPRNGGHAMQRLTRRLRGERGAAAVVLSLLMVPMLGFAAIAVDIGSLYAERARLQVAADASSLAVAQDCARGACGNMVGTASAMVAANDGAASAAPPVLRNNPLSVTVQGSTPVQHWFAPVLGYDATAVGASATVAWGAPGAGTAVLPLTFSY